MKKLKTGTILTKILNSVQASFGAPLTPNMLGELEKAIREECGDKPVLFIDSFPKRRTEGERCGHSCAMILGSPVRGVTFDQTYYERTLNLDLERYGLFFSGEYKIICEGPLQYCFRRGSPSVKTVYYPCYPHSYSTDGKKSTINVIAGQDRIDQMVIKCADNGSICSLYGYAALAAHLGLVPSDEIKRRAFGEIFSMMYQYHSRRMCWENISTSGLQGGDYWYEPEPGFRIHVPTFINAKLKENGVVLKRKHTV